MFIALRDLWQARGRFLLVGGVVALIAFLVVMLSGLTAGLGEESISAVRSLDADYIVLAHDDETSQFDQSQLASSLVETWAGQTGVTSATGIGVTRSSVAHGASTGSVFLIGVPPGSSPAPVGVADHHALMGESLAHTLGVTSGEPVTIGAQQFSVAIGPDLSFSHSPAVWLSLDEWQMVTGVNTVTAVVLAGSSEVATDAVAGTMALTTSESFGTIGSYSQETGSLRMITAFLVVISALVVGAFFTVWTIQRQRDIAVLRAMGASVAYLLGDGLGQAGVVLAIAATVGGVLGVGAGTIVSASVPFHSSVSITALPLVALVCFGMVGASLAIRSITKVDPLTALGTSS